MIHVFGHKSPDSDAIAAAIAFSYWLNQQNIAATPYRLGNINHETRFLLAQANVREPDLLTQLPSGSLLALVDHNESQQSLPGRSEHLIQYVLDHHKLGDLTTDEPAYIRIQPVGSTCTLLYQMFNEQQLPISRQIAMLMAGAIISDTLHLTSPTTTASDHQALASLLATANIRDGAAFAQQLFEAKSDVSDLSGVELVTEDYKQFKFGGKNWGIGSIETVNSAQIKARINELQQAINTVKARDQLDYLMVVIVDILAQQSWAISTNTEQDHIITKAFNAQAEQASADSSLINLGKVVSRKKQMVPTLERYYQQAT